MPSGLVAFEALIYFIAERTYLVVKLTIMRLQLASECTTKRSLSACGFCKFFIETISPVFKAGKRRWLLNEILLNDGLFGSLNHFYRFLALEITLSLSRCLCHFLFLCLLKSSVGLSVGHLA